MFKRARRPVHSRLITLIIALAVTSLTLLISAALLEGFSVLPLGRVLGISGMGIFFLNMLLCLIWLANELQLERQP